MIFFFQYSPSGHQVKDDFSSLSSESRLIHYLLNKYAQAGNMARPVFNSSRAVDVQFAMTLVQLLDFDETKQLLITSVWKSYVCNFFYNFIALLSIKLQLYIPKQQWIDENLSWNPEDYDGLEDIRLPPSITWTPDIVLYNK